MKLRAVILSLCGFLVLAALLSQVLWSNRPLPSKGRHLRVALPDEITGWKGRDMPLGQTESAEGQVEGVLRYDDVYNREFTSGRGTVSLYVAYWEPGKMPVQLVASHTPDRCWTSAGWTCRQMLHDVRLPGLRPGAGRAFEGPHQVSLNVVFWHLVGNELYDYGERFTQVPHPWKWWRDAAKQIFIRPKEQYFIRLSSDRPFEEIRHDPGFQEVLTALAKLGLAEG